MALASKNSLVLGWLLLVAVVQGAEPEPPPKESSDTLETARRDLQELRTLERSLTPSGRLPESTLPLPLVIPSTPTAKTNPGDPNKAAEPSQGWLLDALKRAETEDRARSKTSAADDRLSPEATRRKVQGAPNPLSNYLQQWLSPQDRRLLGGEKLNPTLLEKAGIRDDEPFRPLPNSSTKPLLSSPGDRNLLMDARVNPYLSPALADESFSPEPLAPLPNVPGGGHPPLSRLSNPTSEPPAYSPPLDTTPTLSGPTKPEVLPPPTAPLLDERRYFPQLRRF